MFVHHFFPAVFFHSEYCDDDEVMRSKHHVDALDFREMNECENIITAALGTVLQVRFLIVDS